MVLILINLVYLYFSVNDPQPSTIFEESSAESCIDPVRSRHGASSPSDGGSAATVTHSRTHSDTVQYTSVEVAPVPAPSPASLLVAANTGAAASVSPAGRQIQTHYAAVANPAAASTSDYMVMTPTSASSSLKRHSSLDQGGAEQRRLQMLGLVTDESSSSNPMTRSGSIATTAASPSSQVCLVNLSFSLD